jgi:hypothetical protein
VTRDTEQKSVPYCAVIDLDETLFRTYAYFHDIITDLIDKGLLSPGDADELIAIVLRLRGTDTADWVCLLMQYIGCTSEEIGALNMTYLKESDPNRYFYDGALELLIHLRKDRVPYVVLTKGKQITQQMKLDVLDTAFGAHVPAVITDVSGKAEWIERTSMANEVGLQLPAQLQGVLTKRVYILDDKPRHLVTTSPRIIGIHIDNTDTPAIGSLPIAEAYDQLVAG